MLSALRQRLTGSAGKANRPTVRPRIEILEGREQPAVLSIANTMQFIPALGERQGPGVGQLPRTSVPNLTGGTITFAPGRSLLVSRVSDNGQGLASFTGYFRDAARGVSTAVSGSIWVKSSFGASNPDFGLAYSGRSDPFPGFLEDGVIGGGDLRLLGPETPISASWLYQGTDHDYSVSSLRNTTANNSDVADLTIFTQ
jgi:hypothetical protein